MKKEQTNRKSGNSDRMAKPMYHAYQADESLFYKISITFRRRIKRTREYLLRAKNWIKSHQVPDKYNEQLELSADSVNSLPDNTDSLPDESSVQTDISSTTIEGEELAVPSAEETDSYLGKHARKNSSN